MTIRGNSVNFSNDQILAAIKANPAAINPNFVLNPSGAVNQRVGPYTLTAPASPAYSSLYTMDRWMLVAAASQVASASQVNLGGGLTAMRFGRASGSNTGMIKYIQPFTFDQTKLTIGQPVTLSFLLSTGAGLNANTNISVTIYSGNSATETSNYAGTISGKTALRQLGIAPGTTESLYTLSTIYDGGPVPTTATQLSLEFAMIPTASSSATDYIQIRNVKLELGNTASTFIEPDFNQQYDLCRHFYQKSYDYAVAPKTNNSYGGACMVGSPASYSQNYYIGYVTFTSPMRISPTVNTYGAYSSTPAALGYVPSGSDTYAGSGVATLIGQKGFTVQNATANNLNANQGGYLIHFEANAEI